MLRSVKKTGRCLVIHEYPWTAGFGAEILATIADRGFVNLDAPPRRLTTPDVPIPYAADLVASILPDG